MRRVRLEKPKLKGIRRNNDRHALRTRSKTAEIALRTLSRRPVAPASAPRQDLSASAVMAGFAPSLLEAVAHSVQRLDHVKARIDRFEFLAEPFYVAVDGAIVDIDLIVIGGVHERVAAFHHARPLREGLQDQELGDGQ